MAQDDQSDDFDAALEEWKLDEKTPPGKKLLQQPTESSYTAQCPACKDIFQLPIRHKVMRFSVDPTWGIGSELYVCEKTVENLRRIISTFDISGPKMWNGLIRLTK